MTLSPLQPLRALGQRLLVLVQGHPPSGIATPRGSVRINRRAAAKALAAAAQRHPRVTKAQVKLRRHPEGYVVRCTAEVAGVAGWRRIGSEVQQTLYDALRRELCTGGEVYVTVLPGAVPPAATSAWWQEWAGPPARDGAAAPTAVAAPERAASAQNPAPDGTHSGPSSGRGR